MPADAKYTEWPRPDTAKDLVELLNDMAKDGYVLFEFYPQYLDQETGQMYLIFERE